jgi:2,3-bisphosphoglycerate-independent phosphoglycerate mutase
MSTSVPTAKRPVVLCVLGGIGERAEREGNAVRLARTPALDALATRPRALLAASGEAVGLPAGRPGHGEAGWLAIGSGRVPEVASSLVDRAIDSETLGSDEMLRRLFFLLGDRRDTRAHLFVLASDGGPHASLRHVQALVDQLDYRGVQPVVHVVLDGRDTPPRSAMRWLEPLLLRLERKAIVATVSGRDFALDRDGRWDRTLRYWRAVVKADAPRFGSVEEALRDAYDAGLSDAAVPPARIGDYEGLKGSFMADFAPGGGAPRWDWWGEDVAFAVLGRADRFAQLAALFRSKGLPAEVLEQITERGRLFTAFDYQSLTTLTEADPALDLPVSFPPAPIADTLGEVVARAGMRQLATGPASARPHLERWLAGHRSGLLAGEERTLVTVAPDATDGGAAAIARVAVASLEARAHDLVVIALPMADAAAHTGSLDEALRAVEVVDAAVGAIARATQAADGTLVVTSDHGNCEELLGPDGPSPMHTANPVPLWVVDDARPDASLSDGSLADVAPTVLELLGLEVPAAMTGRSLLRRG